MYNMANSDIRNKINIRNITAEESKEIIKRVCINTFEYKDNRKGEKDNISIDYSKFPEYTKQEKKMIYINDIIDCRIEFLENSEEEQQLKGLPKISPYIISNYIWLENKEYIIEDLNNGFELYVYTNNNKARINKDSYPYLKTMNKIKIKSYSDNSIIFFKYPLYTHGINCLKSLIDENDNLKAKIEDNKKTINILQNNLNMLASKVNIICIQLNLNI